MVNFHGTETCLQKYLDQLNGSNPKAVGFDIFFTEKDKQSPDELIIKSYNLIPSDVSELQNLKSPDHIFSEKLKQSNHYSSSGKQCSISHKL